MLSFAEVSLGTGGLPVCTRCTSHGSNTPADFASVALALTEYASGVRKGSAKNVVFNGFEPFAHPSLPQIISTAADLGFERIRLRTDGGALARHGNAEGALSVGANHLEVVLLGGSETHDRLSERAGLFPSAVAGINAYRAAANSRGMQVFVSAIVPVCKHNLQQLPQTVAAAAALGLAAVAIDASGIKPSPEAKALLEAAVETGVVNLMSAWVTGFPGALSAGSTRAVWTTS